MELYKGSLQHVQACADQLSHTNHRNFPVRVDVVNPKHNVCANSWPRIGQQYLYRHGSPKLCPLSRQIFTLYTEKYLHSKFTYTHNTASLKRTFVNVIAERKQPYILANMYDEYIQMETVPAVRNVDMLECVTIPGSVSAAQNKENDTLHACFTMYGSY